MNIELTAKEISVIRGERILFSNIDFVVSDGELWQICGENGVGKTSFLKILLGLLPPNQGEVYWQGKTIRNNLEFFQSIDYMGHHLGLREELTVLENILFGFKAIDLHKIDETLSVLQLFPLKHQRAHLLSEGQRQRLAWARLLLSNTKLWILDEPFSAMDQAGFILAQEILRRHVEEGNSVVLTTHRPFSFDAIPISFFSFMETP